MNAVVSNKEKVVLVLDIGTSFVKIGLFDTEANPIEDYQSKFEHWMTIRSDGTYIFDANEGIQLYDHNYLEFLRKSDKNVIPVINKCEGKNIDLLLSDFSELGFNEFIFILD